MEKESNLIEIARQDIVIQGGGLEDWLQDDGLALHVGVHVLQGLQQRLQKFLGGIGPEINEMVRRNYLVIQNNKFLRVDNVSGFKNGMFIYLLYFLFYYFNTR